MAFDKWQAARIAPRQHGGAAIEFFLIFPVLLLLLYATVSYAVMFWAYQGLNGMTSEMAGQIIRQEWYEENAGSYQPDMVKINEALAALQGRTGGPAGGASWCSGSDPVISSDDDVERLKVCLEVEEGLLPQISLLGVKLPHETSVSVTATLRVPQ